MEWPNHLIVSIITKVYKLHRKERESTIPPIAAIIGNSAFLKLANSP